MIISPRLSLMALTLMLEGYAVGPDYQPPHAQKPGSYRDLPSQEASRPLSAATQPLWWKNFNDSQLDSLIERAIAGNLTLQQSVLCIAGARERLAQARGGFFPSVNGSAKVTRQQLGLKGLLKSNGVYDHVDSDVANQLNGLDHSITLYQSSFDKG